MRRVLNQFFALISETPGYYAYETNLQFYVGLNSTFKKML